MDRSRYTTKACSHNNTCCTCWGERLGGRGGGGPFNETVTLGTQLFKPKSTTTKVKTNFLQKHKHWIYNN